MRRAWVGLLLAAAAGFGPVSAQTETAVPAEETPVRLTDSAASPATVRVTVGGVVAWRNGGHLRHTVTSDTGLFHSGDVARDGRFVLKFPSKGVFPWFCVYHGGLGGRGMSGVVVVGDAEPPPASARPSPRPEGPRRLRVPEDHGSIQEAADASRPGDLVLVAPGAYEEAVVVSTPGIVVRGLDRAGVVLEGGGARANGVLVAADGVAVENMTARRYAAAGFAWVGADGFRASHLSALDNGDHGVYATGSRRGLIDHVLASGHAVAGIRVAACRPCDTVVADSVAVGNGAGVSLTNAGGNMAVVRTEAARNHAGIVQSTLDSEARAPQVGALVAGNRVHDNGDARAPAGPLEYRARGIGILVAGGRGNRVERNLVERNRAYGVLLAPSVDRRLWTARNNRVEGNLVRGSGRADLALAAPSGGGTCFAGNESGASLPPAAERFFRCGTPLARLGGGDPAVTVERLSPLARSLSPDFAQDARGLPPPPQQAGMDDPAGAPAPPVEAPPVPGIADTPLPTPDSPAPREKEIAVLGVDLSTPLAVALGLYAYALPLVLYTSWVSISLWDVARREMMGGAGRLAWAAVVILVPIIGPVLYLLASRSAIPLGLRVFLVFGGVGAYGFLAAVSFLAQTV